MNTGTFDEISAAKKRSIYNDETGLQGTNALPTAPPPVQTDIEDYEAEMDENDVPIALTLCIIVAYVLLGAALFVNYNKWSWISSMEFT
jgi:hypothetical protein